MKLTTKKTSPVTGKSEDAAWWFYTKMSLGLLVLIIIAVPVFFGLALYAGWVLELIFGVPLRRD